MNMMMKEVMTKEEKQKLQKLDISQGTIEHIAEENAEGPAAMGKYHWKKKKCSCSNSV